QGRLQLELRQKLTELTAGGRTELELDPVEVRADQVVADRLDERQIRQRHVRFAGGADHHRRPRSTGSNLQLHRQPGLPDSGLAPDDDHLAAATVGSQQVVLQEAQLMFATNQNLTERAIHQRRSYGDWAGRRTLDRQPLSSRW